MSQRPGKGSQQVELRRRLRQALPLAAEVVKLYHSYPQKGCRYWQRSQERGRHQNVGEVSDASSTSSHASRKQIASYAVYQLSLDLTQSRSTMSDQQQERLASHARHRQTFSAALGGWS